jgi:hypothetical protein
MFCILGQKLPFSEKKKKRKKKTVTEKKEIPVPMFCPQISAIKHFTAEPSSNLI